MATLGEDFMTTAVEGAIGYFAVITGSKRSRDGDWQAVTVEDVEAYYDPTSNTSAAFEPVTVKATQLVKAAREMVKEDYNLNAEMKGNIRRALRERDAAYIDAYDAQAIFQQAAFGEQVFG